MEKDKILMVRSNCAYYKLPGGGVEEGETHIEALMREVEEETGYTNTKVVEELGMILEQGPDHSSPDSYFQMESHHFLCELGILEKGKQSLRGYELEEGYTPIWISIQEALDSNKSIYNSDKSKVFILRENYALERKKSFRTH